MTAKTTSYRDALLKNLADPDEAKRYLNAVLQDYPEGFLKALRNVAEARQLARFASESGARRELPRQLLPEEGTATLETLTPVLDALGLKLIVGVRAKRRGNPRREASASTSERHA